MSISKLPRMCCHWRPTGISNIKNTITINVFENNAITKILSIHFNNNEYMHDRSDPTYDSFYKIRPILHFSIKPIEIRHLLK